MSVLWTVAVIFVGTMAASVCHEATHYLAARALGVHVRFDVVDWAEHFEASPDALWRTYAVYGAPVVTGLVVAALVVGGVVEVPVVWVVGLTPAWWLYTAHGAVFGDDFRFHAVGTDDEPAPQ